MLASSMIGSFFTNSNGLLSLSSGSHLDNIPSQKLSINASMPLILQGKLNRNTSIFLRWSYQQWDNFMKTQKICQHQK